MAAALLILASATSVLSSPVPYPASNMNPDLIARQIQYDLLTPINATLPNVTILATGGTIASKGTIVTQTVGYTIVSDLIEAVPEVLNISNVRGFQISNVDSGSVNSSILLTPASTINAELAKDDVSGVVVTHGTDTLEETAFFLDLVTNSSKPVVVVGAMRPATALSADGPLNLYQAVTLAVSSNALNRGTMITLNDRIGSAFYTTKNNANSLDTFFSTEAGQLGFFINQVPYFYFEPARPIGKPFFNLENKTSLSEVDILYAHQDMNPQLAELCVANGAQGIVFSGVGAGGVSASASHAAEALFNATGVPMVASHRSADGFVPENDDFMVASGFFNPQKARVLLQLALSNGMTLDHIRSLFAKSYPSP